MNSYKDVFDTKLLENYYKSAKGAGKKAAIRRRINKIIGGEKYRAPEKSLNRENIIKLINNGDAAVILESPQMLAVKEIYRQMIFPKFILIPNKYEFKEIEKAIKKLNEEYKSSIKLRLLSCELNEIFISGAKYDFIWADYCGTISKYFTDLKRLFNRNNLKRGGIVVLTYSVGRTKAGLCSRKTTTFYLTDAIAAIQMLAKKHGKYAELIPEVSGAYKNGMYTLGFRVF